MFALLVPSCCDKSGTSCYHLVTRLTTVTDLLQVVPTRLIQAVRNKYELVAINLLRADDISLQNTLQCRCDAVSEYIFISLYYVSEDSPHDSKSIFTLRHFLSYQIAFIT